LFTGRISVNCGCPTATGKRGRGDRASGAVLGPAKPDVYNVSLALLAWHLGLDDLCEPQLDRRMLRTWLDRAAKPMPPAATEVLAAVETSIAASVYGGDRR
jgi:hypothetical protein